jgi:hypothetical protein
MIPHRGTNCALPWQKTAATQDGLVQDRRLNGFIFSSTHCLLGNTVIRLKHNRGLTAFHGVESMSN